LIFSPTEVEPSRVRFGYRIKVIPSFLSRDAGSLGLGGWDFLFSGQRHSVMHSDKIRIEPRKFVGGDLPKARPAPQK